VSDQRKSAEVEPTQMRLPASAGTPATIAARARGRTRAWAVGGAGVVMIIGTAAVMLRPNATAPTKTEVVASVANIGGNAPSSAMAPTLAPAENTPIKWIRTRQSKWATDGTHTIGFELPAERDVPVWMNRVRPTLAARCLSRHIEIFVVTGAAASVERIDDRHTVQLSFDGGPDVSEQWIDSSDKQALFAPDGAALARRIATARHIRFGFTPYAASAVAAEFDVRGFDSPLDAMEKTCSIGAPRHK
jgi:hypothetical protein